MRNLIRAKLICTKCGRQITSSQLTELSVNCDKCGQELAVIESLEIRGFVYILTNPRMHGLYKVGQTEGDPFVRASQLSAATGVPEPYEVEAYFPSLSPTSDETKIHQSLSGDRLNPAREFFAGAFSLISGACIETTGFEPLFKCDRLKKCGDVLKYDPWLELRPKPEVKTVYVDRFIHSILPPLSTPEKIGRSAQRIGKHWYCPKCKVKLERPDDPLRHVGVSGICYLCNYCCDSKGFELF